MTLYTYIVLVAFDMCMKLKKFPLGFAAGGGGGMMMMGGAVDLGSNEKYKNDLSRLHQLLLDNSKAVNSVCLVSDTFDSL